ncbi:hypothetical protein AAEU32_05800 [Pseudoalteromonas sp. SSDWG2]|uniref:hypothetical protein n=1 Tax=Pseudoalteromonas sp. SSDWG2 TaxID=3139391 RepID=UPI003BAD4229
MMAKPTHIEQLFERALSGESLSAEQMDELHQDTTFGPMLEQAQFWQQSAQNYQEQDVPSTFNASEHINSVSSQRSYLPWLAASVMAVSMFVGGYQVYGTNQQLQMQLAQQQRVLDAQKEKMQRLGEALLAQQQLQQETLAQMTTQTIDLTRSERKDAMTTLVDYINAQRAEDNAYLRLQLNDIAEQIEQQPLYSTAYNTESK